MKRPFETETQYFLQCIKKTILLMAIFVVALFLVQVAHVSSAWAASSIVNGIEKANAKKQTIIPDNQQERGQQAIAKNPLVTEPLSITIKNNQSIRVGISQQDINRLFVSGDKIIRIDAPRDRLKVQHDNSGSVFVSISGDTAVTAFIGTEKGYHFSLLMMPQDRAGITVELVPDVVSNPIPVAAPVPVSTSSSEVNSVWNENRWIQRLQLALSGQVLTGDQILTRDELIKNHLWPIFSIPKRFDGQRHVLQSVVSVTLGKKLAVRIIRVTNRTRKMVRLEEHRFFTKSVRAVAIPCHHVLPRQSALVYEVINYG